LNSLEIQEAKSEIMISPKKPDDVASYQLELETETD